VCQKTYCLDHLHIPEAMLPDGFEAHSVNFVIKGICPHCREK
jgi:Fur family ferric uptake transcriptional regulator